MKTLGSTTIIALFLLFFITGIKAQTQTEKQDQKLMDKYRFNYEKIKDPLVFIQKVINVNHTAPDGASFLVCASFYGDKEVCEMLIDKGANLDLYRSDGMTALIAAIIKEGIGVEKEKYMEIVKLLVDKGANLELRWIEDNTALMLASGSGQTEIVKLLIDKGANLELQNVYGQSALTEASGSGHIEVVKLLLDKGAKLDVRNVDGKPHFLTGMTALMLASLNGHLEVVKLLLEKGADPNLKSKEGKTAYDYAKNSDIKALFIPNTNE